MSRSRRRVFSFLLAIVVTIGTEVHGQLPTGLGSLPPPLPVRLDKLDPLLLPAIQHLLDHSRVVVRARDAASVNAVGLLIQQTGGVVSRALPIIEGFAADIPNVSLALLTNFTIVRRIALDRPAIGTMERTGAATGALAARQAFGLDGTGVRVAVIDSGIAPAHDDLADGPASQRVDQF